MGKKKKIREEFEVVFSSGDEKKIKKMLEDHPWLLSEKSTEMDKSMIEQSQILAAIGIMEDEICGPVKIDEIILSLKDDLNIQKNKEDIGTVLNTIENLGLVKKESNGWILTRDGGRICDDYLNKTFKDVED